MNEATEANTTSTGAARLALVHRSRLRDCDRTIEATKKAGEWLTLWELAQTMAPLACKVAAWWGGGGLPPDLDRAETMVMANDPSVRNAVTRVLAKLGPNDDPHRALDAMWTMNPDFLQLVEREIAARTDRRRQLACHLYLRLGYRVRALLRSGTFEVTALNPGEARITVTAADLPAFDVDLPRNALVGGLVILTEITVRQRTPENMAHMTPSTFRVPQSSSAPERVPRHNGLDFSKADEPLIAKMRSLITAGEVKSPENAARSVVQDAEGGGSPYSKVKRLALRYRKKYPAE